jgi:signal transduction histidine kinase
MRRIERHWFEILVAVVGLYGAAAAAAADDAREPETSAAFAAAAIALLVLPLLARRRFPFAAPAAVWLVAIAVCFVDGRLVIDNFSAFAAGLAATFLLGRLPSAARARTGLVLALGGAVAIVENYDASSPGDLFTLPALFGVAWFTGLAVGERSARAEDAEERAAAAEREREALARLAVAEERTRIAREMHDVVAHAVSVMVLQVGAVRHGLPEALAAEREALTGVERAGRTAMAEMRQLLGAMREAGEDLEMAPQPGLEDLGGLLEEIERAGLPVRLEVEGAPGPVPRAIELSAYRIVQEGLTNALKHAHASRAEVLVGYAPEELRIEVRDDGDGTGDGAAGGGGHGLVGVRERVKILGGEMTAGVADGGGFVLRTRLPLAGRS